MKSEDEVSTIPKNKYNKNKNRKNKKYKTTTNLHLNKSLWNQKKYQVGTWCKPQFQQSLSQRIMDKLPHPTSSHPIIQPSIASPSSSATKELIVDITPQTSHKFPSLIQTSVGSIISSLTKEKPFKKTEQQS